MTIIASRPTRRQSTRPSAASSPFVSPVDGRRYCSRRPSSEAMLLAFAASIQVWLSPTEAEFTARRAILLARLDEAHRAAERARDPLDAGTAWDFQVAERTAARWPTFAALLAERAANAA